MATKNIQIRPGVTKTLQFVWYTVDPDTKVKTPVDLTNYTVKMQVRKGPGEEVLLEIATGNTTSGTITTSALGVLEIEIPASVTANYTTEKAFYDILLTSPTGYVTDFMEGAVSLKRGITTNV